MLEVSMFMLGVDSLNQMINPLPRQHGSAGPLPRILACGVIASPEVRPTTRLTGRPRLQGGDWMLCFFADLQMQ